jgi:hypothetical protein
VIQTSTRRYIMPSHCPHGVQRELIYKGEELRAFVENCDVCAENWKTGAYDNPLTHYWTKYLLIGQTRRIDI